MTHYTDDELAWHLLEPRGDIAEHLEECAECSARNAALQWFDAALSTPATWKHPRNLTGEDPGREHLRQIASRLSIETADAERSLGSLIANPLPFIWKDVSRKRGFRTAGAVLVLCSAANAACERDPLHALNLADAALAIATSFNETEHYLSVKVHQLTGHAWKERANALRYLGRFSIALDALDQAKREYERADANPWDLALLLYTRGIVLYRSARASEAEQCADEAAVIFAATGDRARYVHARMLRASVRYWRQDFAGARDDYRALLDRANEQGDDLLAARLSSAAANCELDLGNARAAEPALFEALLIFEREGMETEAARVRWALARVPLVEGHFAVAISQLRASRIECKRLGLANDEAYIALDLVEALVATGADMRDVQKICRDVFATFKAAGMVNEALTALAYLREATRARTITTQKVRHVRRFLLRLEDQPTLLFDPREHES
jgi:tetratricopeptide (TPR) repeat protein